MEVIEAKGDSEELIELLISEAHTAVGSPNSGRSSFQSSPGTRSCQLSGGSLASRGGRRPVSAVPARPCCGILLWPALQTDGAAFPPVGVEKPGSELVCSGVP